MLDMSKVGPRIKEQRKAHKESQSTVAEAVGVDPQTVGRWERGENKPPIERLDALAHRWNVPLEYLTGESGQADLALFYEEQARLADRAEAQMAAERMAERERLRSLFEKCRFCYEDLEGSPFADFIDVVGGPGDPIAREALHQGRFYRLTSIDGSGLPPIYFSKGELSALLDALHHTIAFECFKRWQAQEKERAAYGND